jgi:4-amino-4-deoxy-L-arabinose transferase-like glycosyltransferase
MLIKLPCQFWPVLLWLLLVLVSLATRPLIPIDETRYLTVTWEMWIQNDFLVPHLNGDTYSHKPPLLFWLIQFSWWVFGVNEWTARLISPLFALAALYLSRSVAQLLWPDRRQIADATPLVLIGCFVWLVFSTLTMFDIMLTFFALVGVYSLLKQAAGKLRYRYWLLMGIAIGGGVLTKGPVILLHVLPVALLAPWWRKPEPSGFCWRQWYLGLVSAVLVGVGIALSWAIPAGTAGGEAYRNAIFFGQTGGRIVDSFAHKLPWWWYLQIVPLILLPWLLFKPFWHGLKLLTLQNVGVRFCFAWLLPVFLAFSLISGKRIHYLLPLLPGMALLLAWCLTNADNAFWQKPRYGYAVVLGLLGLGLLVFPFLNSHFLWMPDWIGLSPIWGVMLCLSATGLAWLPTKTSTASIGLVAFVSVTTALSLAGGFFSINKAYYNTLPPALKIAEFRQAKQEVFMFTYKYHGQFQFTGRLEQPLQIAASSAELLKFARNNPNSMLLVGYKKSADLQDSIFNFSYRLKSHSLGFLPSKTLLANPKLLASLKPL